MNECPAQNNNSMALILLFIPVTYYIGKRSTVIQREKMSYTDRRVKVANESLQAIKFVKLNAWEEAIERLLREARRLEMRGLRKLELYKAATQPVAVAVPNLACVLTFITYVSTGNALTPSSAFAVVSLFVIIRTPFTSLPMALSQLSRLAVMSSRFDRFFEAVMRDDAEGELEDVKATWGEEGEDNNNAVEIVDGYFSWTAMTKRSIPVSSAKAEDLESATLKAVNVKIKRGELLGVVGVLVLSFRFIHRFNANTGRVASGKSSFCNAIIGEINLISGTRRLKGGE